MSRWISLASIMLLLAAMIPGVAQANTGLAVDLSLTTLAGEPLSSASVGDRVLLQVSLSAEAGSVSDIYGSAVDIYYDPTLLEPVLPGTGQTSATTAEGLVTAGMDPASVFTAVTGTGTSASPARLSLIALRTGSATAGAAAGGSLGTVEFVTLRTGTASFTAQAAGASAPGSGQAVVTLLDSQGGALAFSGNTASLNVALSAPVINAPLEMAYLRGDAVAVSGTGPANSSLGFTLTAGGLTVRSGTFVTNAAGGFSETLTGLGDSTYLLTVQVGGTSATRTFVADGTPPVLAIDPPAQMTDPYTVTGSYSDPNIDAVYLAADNSGAPLETDRATLDGAGGWSKSVRLSGSGVLYAVARDKSGNETAVSLPFSFIEPAFELKLTGAEGEIPIIFGGDRLALEAHVYNAPGHMRGLLVELVVATGHFSLESADPVTTAGSLWGAAEAPIVTYDASTGLLSVRLTSDQPPAEGVSLAFTIHLTAHQVTTPTAGVAVTAFAPATTTGGVELYTASVGELIPAATPTASTQVDLVIGGGLSGQVELLGRSDWSGTEVIVLDLTDRIVARTTTDNSGFYTVRVPQGADYRVGFSRLSYLPSQVVGLSMATADLTGVGAVLKPGEITGMSGQPPRIFLEDLAHLARNWGAAGTAADLDGNGTVDLADLSLLGQYWGVQAEESVYTP